MENTPMKTLANMHVLNMNLALPVLNAHSLGGPQELHCSEGSMQQWTALAVIPVLPCRRHLHTSVTALSALRSCAPVQFLTAGVAPLVQGRRQIRPDSSLPTTIPAAVNLRYFY